MSKNKKQVKKGGSKAVPSAYAEDVNEEEKDVARFLDYSPRNSGEEKDLLLASMIYKTEECLLGLEIKLGGASHELRKLDLERQIHQVVMADKKADKNWEYNFSEDYYFDIKRRQDEIRDEINYLEQYIISAKKLIKNDKYKNIPPDFWRIYHWDGEGVDFWDGSRLSALEDFDSFDF